MSSTVLGAVFAAVVAHLLATALGAFARALDRLGAIRRRAFAEEHSESARALLDRGPGEAGLRTALGALRAAAHATTAGLIVLAFLRGGASAPVASGLGVAIPLALVSEISLALLVRGGRAIRVLLVLAPVVRVIAAPLMPLMDLVVDPAEEPGPGDAAPQPETTEERVRAFLELGREEGILEENEERLVASIVDFGDRVVREVMTPRIDIVGAAAGTPLPELAARFVESKFARLPIYRDTLDRVVGIVHVQDLLSAMVGGKGRGAVAGALAKPATFVPETSRIAQVMAELQQKRIQMAIVLDEFGGVSGLVTLEDLLEEIVGEIGDEHEGMDDATAVRIGDGEWRIAGRSRPDELEELFPGIELPHGDEDEAGEYDTVAGLLASRLGHIPQRGEKLAFGPLELEVVEADHQRVRFVRARRTEIEGGDEGASEGARER